MNTNNMHFEQQDTASDDSDHIRDIWGVCGIINGNLAALNGEQISVCERRLCHIREKARLIATEFDKNHSGQQLTFSGDSLRELYRDVCGGGSRSVPSAAADYSKREIADFYEILTVYERISLCRSIVAMFSSPVSEENFFCYENTPASNSKQNRISYLRNAYADMAYRKFSEAIEEATVSYCDDFTAVCEDVYYGHSEFCILPLESSGEGRLASFRNLINKYELKIAMTCPVISSDGSTVTKFALLKKNIGHIRPVKKLSRADFFEFSVKFSSGTSPQDGSHAMGLEDILLCARYCRLTLYKIDSSPISYSDTEYSYDLIFRTDRSQLDVFLCFLYFEAPQFTPVGIYSHLL